MYLITGSTGNVGRDLVDQLHKKGHEVRALVRDASRADVLPKGIDIAVGVSTTLTVWSKPSAELKAFSSCTSVPAPPRHRP